MKCEIIRDLLPLYCDKLTSAESNEEIEKHLDSCSECADICQKMRIQDNTDISDTNVEPLKKVRRKNILKIIAGFVSGVMLLGVMFLFMFVGVIPASSEDVSVTYSGTVLESGVISVDFELSTDKRFCLGSRGKQMMVYPDEMSQTYYIESIVALYRVFKIPFDDRGETPNECMIGFSKQQGLIFGENDTFTIQFRDGDVTYNLKEIAEELGLQ